MVPVGWVGGEGGGRGHFVDSSGGWQGNGILAKIQELDHIIMYLRIIIIIWS